MNTKNIKELEECQNNIIKKWNATLLTGIKEGYIIQQDGMPWVSIMGKFDKETGLKLAQELSTDMNISIILNRIESWYALNGNDVVHLIYDIDKKINDYDPVMPNAKINPAYGIKLVPEPTKKLKIK